MSLSILPQAFLLPRSYDFPRGFSYFRAVILFAARVFSFFLEPFLFALRLSFKLPVRLFICHAVIDFSTRPFFAMRSFVLPEAFLFAARFSLFAASVFFFGARLVLW